MDYETIKGAEAFYDMLIRRLKRDAVDPIREGLYRQVSDVAVKIMQELREEAEKNVDEMLRVMEENQPAKA